MPPPLSVSRALVAEDFILSNGTLILLKALPVGVSQPTPFTLTVGAAGVLSGGLTVPLAAPLPSKLYSGVPILFGSVKVIPTIDVAAGLSAIPIEAATAAIAAAATATTLGLLPFYSSNESSTQGSEVIVESQNFLSGDWGSKRIAKLDWDIPMSGDFIIDDPGALAIKAAWKTRSKVYAEIINPGGQGGDYGTGFVSKYNFTRKQNQNCSIGFTLIGDGPLYDIPVTP